MAYLEKEWKDFLSNIFYNGFDHTKDDSPIREVMGNYLYISTPFSNIHELPIKNPVIFTKAIKNGQFNINSYPIKDEALYEYVTAWDKMDMINCDNFVYTYPERLFNYPQNQYNIIKKRLLRNAGSNRGVAVLYNPIMDAHREDIPCLNWLQATIRNKELELHCMFRSNDIYGAWPSNMMLLTYLGMKLASEFADVEFKGIHYHSSSAHYYKTDEDAIKKIIGV